jgi:hypothetical protein
VVEGSGLENRQGGNSFVSSNLTHAVVPPQLVSPKTQIRSGRIAGFVRELSVTNRPAEPSSADRIVYPPGQPLARFQQTHVRDLTNCWYLSHALVALGPDDSLQATCAMHDAHPYDFRLSKVS